MISRLSASTTGMVFVALAVLAASTAQAAGPSYSYIGVSYEWTDVKYGINPKIEDAYNNGTIEGENIDFSIGILSWLHLQGQAFGYMDGTCKNCNTDIGGNPFDADVEGFKVGMGVNLGLDLIGLSEDVDLVIRGNFIDVELSNLNATSPLSIDDDGWSAETMIRGQISDNADVQIGYEYSRLNDTRNRDVTIGLNYRMAKGLSVLARGLIFDSETGFELGVRWQFGDLLFGDGDSIIH